MDVVKRGEVWWVDFGDPVGSEPGYRRPAVIVSSDRFNASRIATVIACAVTSNMRLALAPGNVELANSTAGLTKPSVVNVSQTLTINKAQLLERIGALSAALMRQVDDGLRLVLSL